MSATLCRLFQGEKVLLGVYPCALLKTNRSNIRSNCECSSVGPVRLNRLETSSVRTAPYPQPSSNHNQPQTAFSTLSSIATTAIPDSTVQEVETVTHADSQDQLRLPKTAEQSVGISPAHCPTFVQTQAKIATPNAVAISCTQNSAPSPYSSTPTIPVIQPPCVLPVEQCVGNGVLTNISSNGSCLPASPCYTTIIPASIVGSNTNACVPVTRFHNPVVESGVTIGDCRCQTEGSNCCHSAITSYAPAPAPTSMIFVPYSIPNFPPQQRGNVAVNSSCGGTTPVKFSPIVYNTKIRLDSRNE
ncbi:hypothetical protein RUM43_007256 [Polyplax serrata]|uniref:Uncharacterized protein n=1 Tax=Polyplax serrata TaxID=468196 RepID=A0AAN8SA54_POLSC